MKVLIAEDDPVSRRLLQAALVKWGYEVIVTTNGKEAWEVLQQPDAPSLLVLDWLMPETDGVEVCRQARDTPALKSAYIILLTSRTNKDDVVQGLEAGADDYVTKPFGAEELLARIRATLRRVDNPSPPSEPIVRGNLVIDRERFRVLRDGEEVRLTPKEFELLTFLALHPGRVLTHRAILKAVWGSHVVDQPEHLRVLVGLLRKKIEPNPARPVFIHTIHGDGYCLTPDGEQ